MSVQPTPLWVIRNIANDYCPGGRFYGKSLPEGSPISAIVAEDPHARLHKDLLRALGKKKMSATKMLKLFSEVKACTSYINENPDMLEGLLKLIQDEADRLIDRAVDLSNRYGHKARVRLSTLKALHKAGFIEAKDLEIVEHNMLTQQQVRKLVATYNGVDAIRWEQLKKAYSGLFQESTPVVKTRKVKTRKPTINKASRREAGVVVLKPMTKAAFLLSVDGGKKQAIKAERTAKAQARRRGFKANGGAKVGGPGEGVTVRHPVPDWCKAGHAGRKVAK